MPAGRSGSALHRFRRVDIGLAGLRDSSPQQHKSSNRTQGEEQEGGRVAGQIDNVAGDRVAERGAEPPGRRGGALREVVAAGAPGEVRDNDEKERTEDAG